MNLIEKLRDVAARWARQRQIYTEMATMSDAEMRDLNLSHAKISDLSKKAAQGV